MVFLCATPGLAEMKGEIITVQAKKDGKKYAYYINGRRMKEPNLLLAKIWPFREDSDRKVREYSVVVLMSDGVTFYEWGQIKGILQKIGFQEIEYYSYSKGSGFLEKVKTHGLHELPCTLK